MADLTNEIAAIQVATTGTAIRSAIVEALNSLNALTPSWYSGSYFLSASTVSMSLPTSGYTMAADIMVHAFPVYSGSYTITPSSSSISLAVSNLAMTSDLMIEAVPLYNGSYSIAPSTISQILSTSGLLMNEDLIIEAFPEASLITKTITSNGIYSASDDSADGYSEVTVSIPEYVGSYVIIPSTISQELSVSGLLMSSNLIIESTPMVEGSLWADILNKTVSQIDDTDGLVTNIGQYAFESCSLLSRITCPSCSTIGTYAFKDCLVLNNVSFSLCTIIGSSAFQNDQQLETVSFPEATEVNIYGFGSCVALSDTSFPKLQSIYQFAFNRCESLSVLSLPSAKSIYANAFKECTNLISLYLLGSEYCSLFNSNAFSSTPIGGYSTVAGQYGTIYVPSSMYSSYITMSNWITLSNRFSSM